MKNGDWAQAQPSWKQHNRLVQWCLLPVSNAWPTPPRQFAFAPASTTACGSRGDEKHKCLGVRGWQVLNLAGLPKNRRSFHANLRLAYTNQRRFVCFLMLTLQ